MKEDFSKFFKVPGLLGGWFSHLLFYWIERLFNLFDENRDGKIFWSEFKAGILTCMYGGEEDIGSFIFHFFDMSE